MAAMAYQLPSLCRTKKAVRRSLIVGLPLIYLSRAPALLPMAASGQMGSVGDYYWGGAAGTIFWVDPVEDMFVIFMTQLMPSATFNFRGQIKNIIYGAIAN